MTSWIRQPGLDPRYQPLFPRHLDAAGDGGGFLGFVRNDLSSIDDITHIILKIATENSISYR